MHEGDARLAQARKIELRSAAAQVVERHDLPVGMACGEPHGDIRTDEARTTGYEHLHSVDSLSTRGAERPRQGRGILSRSVSSLATQIRRSMLEQSMRAHVGHIGSALSIADLMAALYGDVLQIGRPEDPDRDRFILSKGHAALALYAALHATGRLSEAELDSYCADGSLLGGHPEHALGYVDFATGSLGHGLSVGAGAALAARLGPLPRRVFVLMSDAECNEGSVWEAVMFAAHHQLANLVAIVDVNGQQALGYTRT